MDSIHQLLQQYATYADTYAVKLLLVLVILIIAIVVATAVQRIMSAVLTHRSPTWSTFLTNVVQILVILGAVGAIVQTTGIISAAVLLTILTLFTAGASLSASNLISDALATIRILSLGYYRVNDLVTVAGDTHGLVTSINAFSTVLKTRKRDKVIVNNGAVISEIVHVHTGYKGQELPIRVPVCSDHDRRQVVDWLLEVARAYPHCLSGPEFEPRVYHEFNSDSEDYTLVVYVEDEFENRHHAAELSIAAGEKLNAHDIEVGETAGNQNEISGSIRIGALRDGSTAEPAPGGANGTSQPVSEQNQPVVLIIPNEDDLF